MNSPSVGAKLFNTIVVIGMSLSQTTCSDDDGKTTQPVETLADASTRDNAAPGDDSAVPDAGTPGSDAFAGWFCCG